MNYGMGHGAAGLISCINTCVHIALALVMERGGRSPAILSRAMEAKGEA